VVTKKHQLKELMLLELLLSAKHKYSHSNFSKGLPLEAGISPKFLLEENV